MATTKKSTKRKTRKRSRRYLKKAARRTIAALLMITALIVAAIPATPGRAETGESGDGENTASGIDFPSFTDIFVSDENKAGSSSAPIARSTVSVNSSPYILWFSPSSESDKYIFEGYTDMEGNDPAPGESADVNIDSPFTGINKNTLETVTGYCTQIGPDIKNYPLKAFTCNSVETVGNNMFKGSTTLVSFTANGATTVESSAFEGCTSLTSASLEKAEGIGTDAFKDCERLTDVTVFSVKTIANSAFSGCIALENFNCTPNTLTDIGSEAFSGCKSLTSFIFPEYLNTLGAKAFYKCEALTGPITVPGPDTGGPTGSVNTSTFEGCISLGTVKFGDSIASISSKAFKDCVELTNLTLPANLSSAASDAFENCSKLQFIAVPGSVKSLNDDIFSAATGIIEISLSNNAAGDYYDIPAGFIPLSSSQENYRVKGYRKNVKTDQPTKAYDYCLENKIPYICIDGGSVDQYYDLDPDGYIINARVDKLLENETGGITIPDSINTIVGSGKEDVPIKGIAKTAFTKYAANLSGKYIGVDKNAEWVKEGALAIDGLKCVSFNSVDTQLESGSLPDTSKPANKNFYVWGDIVDESKPLEFCMANGYTFMGYGNYDEGDRTQLTVKYQDGDNTLVAVNKHESPSEFTEDVNLGLPSGIHQIKTDLTKNNTKITGVKTDNLKKIFDDQFGRCSSLHDIDISGSFNVGDIGELPFKSCTDVHTIKINDNNGNYSVDGQGVIYEKGDSGKTIVEGIENKIDSNNSTRYTVPEDVVAMRDRAFQDNRWIRIFSNIYGNNTTHQTKIKIIPKYAFYNARNLATAYFGTMDPKTYINEHALDYDPTISNNWPDMDIYVYDEQLTYGSDVCADSERLYQFYSKKNDTTYDLCEVLESDTHDNLIWNDIGKVTTKTLSGCKIEYPKTRYRDYDNGKSYTFQPGVITDTEDPNCADLVVKDPNGTPIDPSFYVVQPAGALTNKTGTKNDDKDIPFIITGDGVNYDTSVTLDGYFVIQDGGSVKKSLKDATIVVNNPISFYKGDKSVTFNPDTDFTITYKGTPLVKGTDYTIDPPSVDNPKDGDNITVTFTGKNDYEDSVDIVFTLKETTKSLKDASIEIYNPVYFYTGDSVVTFVQGQDYSIKYDGNPLILNSEYTINPSKIENPKDGDKVKVTFTGIDNYTDSVEKEITLKEISKGPFANCDIVFPKPKIKYTGKDIRIDGVDTEDAAKAEDAVGKFYVVSQNGVILKPTSEYLWEPEYVKDVDTYVLVVKGKGQYTGGVLTKKFSVESDPSESSISVNLILNGPDRSAVNADTYKATNTFQYWNEGNPKIKSVVDKYGNALKNKKDYVVQSYGTVRPGLGKKTGYVQIQFKGKYADEGRQNFYYDIKKDLSRNTSDDGKKSVTIQATEATIDSNDKIEATISLTDSTTGTDLAKDTDYMQGQFKKTSSHHADVKITGKGDKYCGTYTYNFQMDEKKSSSSSGSSSSSSSKSSSSSGSSSMMSSSASGSSSSYSGSGNKNSGTTVVNRNYYGKNGGTVDELEDMLRAAHIDSINGGTADGYQVNITKSDEAEASFREALIRRYGSLDNIRYFSMDIDVKDENGNDIDTTGMSVTLTLPLPRSMEQYGTNNKVATVDSNGDLEDLNEQFSTLEGRPCVTFVAPHFSPYGFYVNTADLAVGTLDNTPKTGDPIHPKWFLSFGLAALSIFLFLKRDPKPQVKPA